MVELNEINIQASINRKWLTYNERWFHKLGRFTTLFLLTPFILFPITMMAYEQFTNANELFFLYVVFPVSLLAGAYGIFRVLTEKRLIKIETGHGQKVITKAIRAYAKKYALDIDRHSDNCIILISHNPLDFRKEHKKARIFIIGDGLLLFTVMRFGYAGNFPVFFTHLFVKRDLQKLLQNTGV